MQGFKKRGYSLRGIGNELIARGFNSKGGGQWYAQTIKQILNAQV